MIALYIILGIIALVALLLCMRVGINIVLEDELRVYLRVLFFKLRIYPQRSKKYKKKKQKQKKKKAETVIRESGDAPKKKPPLTDTIKTAAELVRTFSAAFARHLHVKLAVVNIRVATGDAASTAILYGAVSGAVACLVDAIDEITNLSSLHGSEISVEPDFLSERTQALLNITLSLRVIGALSVLAKTLFRYLSLKSIKNRKETKENGK